MLLFRFVLCAIILIFLNACAEGPHVANANYLRDFGFTQVKSYAFYGRNDENFDYQNLSDLTRNSIEIALENQLDTQGLIYKDITQADIIVSYFWVEEQKKMAAHNSHNEKYSRVNQRYQMEEHQPQALTSRMQLKKYNQGVKYCARCLKVSAQGEQVNPINTAAGALIVDFIASKTKRSVWRSSYPVIIKEKENSREIQQRFQRAVKQMLLQYPKN